MVDLIGFKGSLKAHVTFMTGNLQKLSGLTYNLMIAKREPDAKKVNSVKIADAKIGKLHDGARLVGLLWCSYMCGAIIGAEAATHEWFNDSADWTLMIPASILLICIFTNEGGDYVGGSSSKEFSHLHQHQLHKARPEASSCQHC